MTFKKEEVFIEMIQIDKNLWHEKMLTKLTVFYEDCIFPDIIASRVIKGLKIKDILYIVKA